MSQAIEIGTDLLRYAALCAVSVAIGLAILRLLRVSLPHAMMVTVAPAVTLSWWSVVLGFGVSLGVPVSVLAGPVWALSGGLAAYGIAKHARQFEWGDAPLLALTAALPVCVLSPYFLVGLTDYQGSSLPDGWSYVAMAQYLWTYSIGSEGGLPPLHQYAAHMAHVRHVAGAMLGFLSPFFAPGDTQASSGLFVSGALFVFSTSCAFFALSIRVSSLQLVTYLVFVVVSGWMANVVWANNYDNALALSFAPLLAGLIAHFDMDAPGWRVLLGLVGAGLFYVYPELAPLVAALAVFAALERWRNETMPIRRWALIVATSGTLALAMMWPFVPDMLAFIGNQTSAGLQATGRPGEVMFTGLLSRHFQPSAFWGLGAEFRVERFLRLANLLGAVLSVLAAVGVVAMLRSRLAGVAAWVVLLVTGALFMIVAEQYSYGAYKLILLSWWALALAVVLGIHAVVTAWPLTEYARVVRVVACVALVTAALMHVAVRSFRAVALSGQWTMADYRRVGAIEDLNLSKKVLVAVDERVANEWAVYFLRDMPIVLGSYRMYMAFPHVRPLMDRARSIRPEELGYLLTDDHPDAVFRDSRAWSLVWSAGPYRLWSPTAQTWSIVTGVTNPYGLEEVGGRPFFWMGSATSTVDVVSNADGVLGLNAGFVPGPSVVGVPARRLLLSTSSGYSREVLVHTGDRQIQVPVKAGREQIRLRVLDTPNVPAPNGDPRALLLGVQDLGVALVQQRIAVQRVENRNGIEQVEGRPFFWMGDGGTTITLDAPTAGSAEFSAEFVPGPSVSTKTERHVEVVVNNGAGRRVKVHPGMNSIRVPLRLGENRVVLRTLDSPDRPVTGRGDRRPLVLGVLDLGVRFESIDTAVTIESIVNPNGIEQVGGQPFLWIGGPPTAVTVQSERRGNLVLYGRFIAGPSGPAPPTRKLLVETDHGESRTVLITTGDQQIRIAVPGGRSRITLKALDEPLVVRQPNGDTRPLLIGVSGLAATLEVAPASGKDVR
jgi:hypothetical protein